MRALALTVVLCAHNPREAVIERVLNSLNAQTLDKSSWELLIVDNASTPTLSQRGWSFVPSNTRWVEEFTLGLTPARRAGFSAALGAVIVMVDDDTVLDPRYLENAAMLMRNHPEIGVAGGKIAPEYAVEPPAWLDGFQDMLAIRDFGDLPIRALISNQTGPWEPCGAGMVLRAEVAKQYLDLAGDARRMRLDRIGSALSSCGDTDLARIAPDMGLYQAYEPSLKLLHVIPQGRLRLSYLARLTYSIHRDGWILYRLRGRPSSIPLWRRHAHFAKAVLFSFSLRPQRWVLRAASALGQVIGRSICLEEKHVSH